MSPEQNINSGNRPGGERPPGPYREKLLKLYLLFYLVLLFSTELLSAFHANSRFSVMVVWFGMAVAFAVWFMGKSRGRYCLPWRNLRRLFRLRIVQCILAIAVGCLLCGLLYPPMNYDSMTYHLARVVHWIHHGSIRYYQTDIERQLYQMPLAEIAIMHLQLLAKGDLFAFLPQFAAWMISIISVSCICRQLGGRPSTELFSMLLAATLSMGILQSSSTQNDLVLASFFLVFLVFIQKYHRNWHSTIWAGIAMGLSMATKGTAYLLLFFPGLLIGLHAAMTSRNFRLNLLWLMAIVTTAVCLNIGIYMRSFETTGKIMTGGNTAYFIETTSPKLVVLNMLKHFLLHCLLPDHSYAIGRFTHDGSFLKRHADFEAKTNARLIQYCQQCIPDIDAPEITWKDNPLSSIVSDIHEDFSGDTLHFLLFICSLAFLFRRRHNRASSKIYLSAICLTWLLCAALLKWNIWQARLHLPVMFVWMPWSAIQLSEASSRKLRIFLTCLLLVNGTYTVFFGKPRPLSGKINQLLTRNWRDRREYYPFQAEISELTAHTANIDMQEIGLYCDEDAPVYPVFVNLGIHASSEGKISYDHTKPYLISSFPSIEGYAVLHDGAPFKLFQKEKQPIK